MYQQNNMFNRRPNRNSPRGGGQNQWPQNRGGFNSGAVTRSNTAANSNEVAPQPAPVPMLSPPQPVAAPVVVPEPIVVEAPVEQTPPIDDATIDTIDEVLDQSELSLDQSQNGDGVEPGKKKPYSFKTAKKISKKEKQRRRNMRLARILCPKNAITILNELVQPVSYNISEVASPYPNENFYAATTKINGVDYQGMGRTKVLAKGACAENALRAIIKSKHLKAALPMEPMSEIKTEENSEMDVPDDCGSEDSQLPWQHLASFAIHKLLASWGEDPMQLLPNAGLAQVIQGDVKDILGLQPKKAPEMKPCRKMPPNPEQINPLMLINQMLPHATFQEVSVIGQSPNITYSYSCTCDGESFYGNGSSKKAAKKMAAYAACSKLLKIVYPPDVYCQ